MRVGELLEALAQRDTQSRLSGEATAGSAAFLNTIRKASDWHTKIMRVAGVDDLAILCRADGRKLDHPSVAQYHASLIADHGLTRGVADAMSVKEFVAKVAKTRKPQTKQTKSAGAPTADTTKRVLEKYDEGLTKATQILEWVPEIAGDGREGQLGNIRAIIYRNRTKAGRKA